MEGKVDLAGDGSYYVHQRGMPVSPQGSNPDAEAAGSDRGGARRRKRGRPRKYGPDGLSSFPAATAAAPKRGRGRPPGTGRRQQMGFLGHLIPAPADRMSLNAHMMIIDAGEDITGKIISFAEEGPKPICVLSANGTVSTVTLRQPLASSGMVTYEGRFEIINLTGSLMLTETAQSPNRIEGFNISLANTDGRIIGGVVSGMTIAATPVQVVLGIFGYSCNLVKNDNTQVNPGSGSGTESEPETADAENPDAETSTMPGQSKNSSMLVGEWPNQRQMNSKNARV
ncbi:hypothetical protein J5N97_023598 [Dioscorea zingiberensis]|uniref:AT-hook motif nuclear-localized protein n=1 Tax=Dioscorea zingiberensis TaxID=325984 RepID=A0A9D5C558_9LILI|nr:hypothetical protein J5N97_023598 [Dioscorea zingiberensis]